MVEDSGSMLEVGGRGLAKEEKKFALAGAVRVAPSEILGLPSEWHVMTGE